MLAQEIIRINAMATGSMRRRLTRS